MFSIIITRKMPIKTTMRSHSTSIRMSEIVKPTPILMTLACVGENVEQVEFPVHWGWPWKIVKPL